MKTGEIIMGIKSPGRDDKTPMKKYSEKQKQLFSIYCAQPTHGSKLGIIEKRSNLVQKKRQMSREVSKQENLSGLEVR